jgi:hypothetical protein
MAIGYHQEHEYDWDTISPEEMEELTVKVEDAIITYLLTSQQDMFSAEEISREMRIPFHQVQEVVFSLMEQTRLDSCYELSCSSCGAVIAFLQAVPGGFLKQYCEKCDIILATKSDRAGERDNLMNTRSLSIKIGEWASSEERLHDRRRSSLLIERQQKLVSELDTVRF